MVASPPVMADDPHRLRQRLEEVEAELEQLQLTLAVLGTVDLATGIRNRNGILEGLERGARWLGRRGDIYGLLLVGVPGLAAPSAADPELVRHLAATVGAGVREVDEVGRLDETTFAAVLFDLAPDSIEAVTQRVRNTVSATLEGLPLEGGFRISGVEVHERAVAADAVLEQALELLATVPPGATRTVRR